MFIGEQAYENIFKLESRDVTFLENNFSQRGNITLDLDLFEIKESDISIAPLHPIPQAMIMMNFILVGARGIFRFLKDHYVIASVLLFLDVILISILKL